MDVNKLFNAKHHRKSGHHRCVVNYNKYTGEKESIDFYHHNTCIFIVDVKNKTYFMSDEGYATASTHRALVQYMNFFDELGYKMRGCYIASTRYFPYKFVHR
jgi:hypothetical protein